MKYIFSLLFLAGTLTTAVPSQLVADQQLGSRAADNPQPQAASQASSHDRHHRRHTNTTNKRHHRHHKTSTKH